MKTWWYWLNQQWNLKCYLPFWIRICQFLQRLCSKDTFPTWMNIAKTVFLFQKGDHQKSQRDRTISLLSSQSKFFQRKCLWVESSNSVTIARYLFQASLVSHYKYRRSTQLPKLAISWRKRIKLKGPVEHEDILPNSKIIRPKIKTMFDRALIQSRKRADCLHWEDIKKSSDWLFKKLQWKLKKDLTHLWFSQEEEDRTQEFMQVPGNSHWQKSITIIERRIGFCGLTFCVAFASWPMTFDFQYFINKIVVYLWTKKLSHCS